MNSSTLIFISQNPFKFEELEPMFDEHGLNVLYVERYIKEIQSDNLTEIVREKTLDAFREVGRPVLVDHTGLYIENWNGMPGGLTQLFWNSLGSRICNMLPDSKHRRAKAKTIIGYCDGKNLFIEFEGVLDGTIALEPHDGRSFQWGTIFIPNGFDKAYSELTIPKINQISHRSHAFKSFCDFFKNYSR